MGVVLFQSLAGRPPFEDPSYPALLVRIATEKPPSIGRIRPDVSESMQAIIERAIAKNPDDRFPDMGAFIHALENGLKPPEPYERRLREIAPAESVRTSLHAVPAVADLTDRVHVTSRRPWWGLAAGGVIGVLCLLLWLLIQDDPIKTPPAAQSGPAVVPRPSLMIPPAPATVPGTLMGERGPAATATAGTAGQAQGTASRPASGEASGASVAAGKDGVEASSADGNGEHRRRARRSARVGNGLDLRDGRTDEATVPQNDGTGSADPSTQETQPQGTPGRAATWPQPRAPRAGNLSPDDF
jgi:serine/threonine-protein kinase